MYICVAFSLDLQRAFQVIELRQEAEELVRLLLRWVTEGKAGFGPPHYTTLINTVRHMTTNTWLIGLSALRT